MSCVAGVPLSHSLAKECRCEHSLAAWKQKASSVPTCHETASQLCLSIPDGVQVGKEDNAKQEEEAFAAENIDQILAGRTEKRQIGSRKGNTFSTATFSSNEVKGYVCFSSSCF